MKSRALFSLLMKKSGNKQSGAAAPRFFMIIRTDFGKKTVKNIPKK